MHVSPHARKCELGKVVSAGIINTTTDTLLQLNFFTLSEVKILGAKQMGFFFLIVFLLYPYLEKFGIRFLFVYL